MDKKDHTSVGRILSLTALILTAGLILLTSSCEKDDVHVSSVDSNQIVRNIAIVAPIGDIATKTRLERTAKWFTQNFNEALSYDTLNISLKLEWYDELSANLEVLSKDLAGRDDLIAIIGPFGNESMAQFAPACQKTHKPLIAPTVTSEEIMRRYAVSTAGSKEQINKESFFWPLCQSDVVLTETMLRHYKTQAGQNNLKCAVFSPADKYGQTFYDWAPFHTRNLSVNLESNQQFTTTKELTDCVTGYRNLIDCADSLPTIFCIAETTQHLVEAARIIEPQAAYFVFPSISEEGITALNGDNSATLQGYQGFSHYADPTTGFEQEYEQRFGVKPTFAECKFYDALLLSGLATILYEYFAAFLTQSQNTLNMNEWINSIVIMMADERDYGESETQSIWRANDIRQYIESLLNAESRPLSGASGAIMFDSETHMQIARTTYVNWQIDNNRIIHKTYYGPNGKLLTDTENVFDEESALRDFADMATYQDQAINYPALTGQYAVLVQGSNGMNNYRHQADVLSVYQMLRQNGFDDDHIILIIDGALAFDPNNNEPGVIRNNMLGHDLLGGNDSITNRQWAQQFEGYTFFDVEYPSAIVDYDTDSLDAADIADILTGKRSDHLPVVLPQDEGINVLLYWSGHGRNVRHGGTDELVWRETGAGNGMTASLLRQTVEQMNYRKILTIVEPCYSEGVILPLHGLTGVLAMAGASGDEQSWAENWSAVLGRYGTWMYDRFTRNVVNYLTANPTASYRDFYLYCMQNTIGSHVKLVNAEFFGNLYSTTPEEFVVNKIKN